MNPENRKNRITKISIGDTEYIVEALQSESAKESAYAKVKRLILNNAAREIKLSQSSQLLSEIDSTSAK